MWYVFLNTNTFLKQDLTCCIGVPSGKVGEIYAFEERVAELGSAFLGTHLKIEGSFNTQAI